MWTILNRCAGGRSPTVQLAAGHVCIIGFSYVFFDPFHHEGSGFGRGKHETPKIYAAMNEQFHRDETKALDEFIATHFSFVGDKGDVAYKCNCKHPGNCSTLRHHPDIDERLADRVVSLPCNEGCDLAHDFIVCCWTENKALIGAALIWFILIGTDMITKDKELQGVLMVASASLLLFLVLRRAARRTMKPKAK